MMLLSVVKQTYVLKQQQKFIGTDKKALSIFFLA